MYIVEPNERRKERKRKEGINLRGDGETKIFSYDVLVLIIVKCLSLGELSSFEPYFRKVEKYHFHRI